ncbi:MAG: hypothetical protein AB1428_14140 [Bacteroidota bacterium]
MNSSTRQRAVAAIAVTLLLLPGIASACPVCYGASDTSAAQSVNAAIISLLGVTGGVLGAFGAMFIRMRRRMRATPKAGHKA